MPSHNLPSHARVVIIGGGIIGCSVAYHLTKAGEKDVVLLEQGRLTGGTTWHAAGLVGQLRAHQNMTRLVQYSVELYSRLEAETGQATGWKQCGSVIVARTQGSAHAAQAHRVGRDRAGRALPHHLAEGSRREISGDAHRRSHRRALAAERRQGEPRRHHAGARARCAQRWRPHLREDARHRHQDQGRRRHRRLDAAGRYRVRDRRQLCGPMGETGRAGSAASPCRCTPPSTCTSSPGASTASRRTCR